MLQLHFTPEWFNGWDLVLDTIGLVIALLIAAFSWRIYTMHKENRYAYFALAFVCIAIGFGFKLLTNGIYYFEPIRDVAAGVLKPVAGPRLAFADLFYRAGFFLEMAPWLGGLLLLFFISQKPRERLHKYYELTQIGLFVYLILLISVVSNFTFFVFYLTSTVLLSLIVLNYYKNYLNNGNKNTLRVMWAFMLMLCAHVLFVFVFLWSGLYFFGEVLLLAGFLVLLLTYTRVVTFRGVKRVA